MTAREIPLLTAEDIECRVQSVTQSKNGNVGAILLIYKDARVDMRILDQVYGTGNWQRTHELIGNTLYCNIDIWDDEKKCWVRKQDAGTESNTEQEKGRASDSFKRAGFNVGIGRELYTAPFIWIQLRQDEYYQTQQNGKQVARCKPGVHFDVSEIGYDERNRINHLVIVDGDGKVRYTMRPQAKPEKEYSCEQCGMPIVRTMGKGGRVWEAADLVEYSLSKFGKTLCPSCQKVMNDMQTGE